MGCVMAMKASKIGLSPRINADPKSPSAEQDYIVTGMDEGHTLNDAIIEVLKIAEFYLTFYVPNEEGNVPESYVATVYRRGVINLESISSSKAKITVLYKVLTAAVAPSQGGKEPQHESGGGSEDQVIGPEYSFDTQGGTRHITQSIETVDKGMVGGPAPDLQRIIGLSRDKVEGCDVVGSDLKFSVTYKKCKFTFTYLRKLVALTATTNSVKVLTFDPGEVLFMGATGHYTDGDGWVISFNVNIKLNEVGGGEGSGTGIVLIPAGEAAPVTVSKKEGHDYVWFSYTDGVVSGFTVQKPIAAYVERVYKRDIDAAGVTMRHLWSAI